MNAVLAKPIHAIWFIQATWLIYINRCCGAFHWFAAVVARPSAAATPSRGIAALHNQKIQCATLSDQRKARHNTVRHCEAAMHRCDWVGIVCRIALATT
jgi:hypothetical protein